MSVQSFINVIFDSYLLFKYLQQDLLLNTLQPA
jgi:hypothetical protein